MISKQSFVKAAAYTTHIMALLKPGRRQIDIAGKRKAGPGSVVVLQMVSPSCPFTSEGTLEGIIHAQCCLPNNIL